MQWLLRDKPMKNRLLQPIIENTLVNIKILTSKKQDSIVAKELYNYNQH